MAPYFASRVSESVNNLAQLPKEILVDPIQHVPGPMNPADIPTRSNTLPDDVRPGSVWQDGPDYLRLPREAWPFSREFLDKVPDQEMRVPKALFNSIVVKGWKCRLGIKLTELSGQTCTIHCVYGSYGGSSF